MDETVVQQIVDELLSSLEPLETQSAALLQFIKAKGIATDGELETFLEQAGNASNVRWRAIRVRTAALISSAMKSEDPPAEAAATKSPLPGPESPVETSKKNEAHEAQQKEAAGKKEPSPAEPAPKVIAQNEKSQVEKDTSQVSKQIEENSGSDQSKPGASNPATSESSPGRAENKEEGNKPVGSSVAEGDTKALPKGDAA